MPSPMFDDGSIFAFLNENWFDFGSQYLDIELSDVISMFDKISKLKGSNFLLRTCLIDIKNIT